MCVAIAQPAQTDTLSVTSLERGWDRNPHGGGFAFINTDGDIEQFHTMDKDTFVLAYLDAHERYGETSPFILHMRIATHGDVKLSITHPYTLPLKGAGEMVFAHNGIISEMGKFTSSDVSDTMAFGKLVLSQLEDNWLDNEFVFDLVESYLSYSKLVFLTTSPALKSELYIMNDIDGMWFEDVWYSNYSCLSWVDSPKASSKGGSYKRYGNSIKKVSHTTPSKDYQEIAKKFMDKKEAEKAGECHAMGDAGCTCEVCVEQATLTVAARHAMVYDENIDQWVDTADYVEDTFGEWLYEVNVRYDAEELVKASVSERQEMIAYSAEKGDECIICTGIDQCYCNDLCNDCYYVYFDCDCEGNFVSIYRAVGDLGGEIDPVDNIPDKDKESEDKNA